MIAKRMTCLANSRKLGEYCVAGKERTAQGHAGWIRPVSDRPGGALNESERRCQDGMGPRLRDVIEVPLQGPRPVTYQSENWLIAPDRPWRRVGQTTWEELDAMVDDPPTLWLNGDQTLTGTNDRVEEAAADRLSCSLYLLRLADLELRVFAPGAAFGNYRRYVQASFTHGGTPYRLRVTDPVVEMTYLERRSGAYPIGECYATVSLGEPYNGYCYKLVAALMFPPRDAA